MKIIISTIISLFTFISCNANTEAKSVLKTEEQPLKTITIEDIKIEKKLLYDQHTLADVYPYKDTTRIFQWEKIRKGLFFIDSIQFNESSRWAILQNNKNKNGVATSILKMKKNAYNNFADSFGVERYQSIPLFLDHKLKLAERFGRDGSLVKYIGAVDSTNFVKVKTTNFEGEWFVPKKYVHLINDSVIFKKAIFVDRTNQNIATLEKVDSVWYVRSMNPCTTGLRRPPYGYPTPTGIFVIQQKLAKMFYLHDGSSNIAGYAPHASRFCNGAYLHGVPVALPRTEIIEFSPTLGTTPRSHMCIRNASSHAKFIYSWAPVDQTIVMVFD